MDGDRILRTQSIVLLLLAEAETEAAHLSLHKQQGQGGLQIVSTK